MALNIKNPHSIMCCTEYKEFMDFSTLDLNMFLLLGPTHQLDLPVAHDGAEFAEVPHQTIEDVSDAFPLLPADFLHTGQLCLQLHQTGL